MQEGEDIYKKLTLHQDTRFEKNKKTDEEIAAMWEEADETKHNKMQTQSLPQQ